MISGNLMVAPLSRCHNVEPLYHRRDRNGRLILNRGIRAVQRSSEVAGERKSRYFFTPEMGV
jgi:hypothetical protein